MALNPGADGPGVERSRQGMRESRSRSTLTQLGRSGYAEWCLPDPIKRSGFVGATTGIGQSNDGVGTVWQQADVAPDRGLQARKVTSHAHAQTVSRLPPSRLLPCGTKSLATRALTVISLRNSVLRVNVGQYTIAVFLYIFSQTKRRPASPSKFRGCSSPKKSRSRNLVPYVCACHAVRGLDSRLHPRPKPGNPAEPRCRNRSSQQV